MPNFIREQEDTGMIIIPIGHESDEVQRLPWVTFGIMALCLIFHIFISIQVSRATKGLESSVEELVRYYFDHPYLELNPETLKLMFGSRGSQKVQEMLSVYRYSIPPPNRSDRQAEQEKLDQLTQSLRASFEDFPYRKWGFIPAHKSNTSLLTYMFIHGGWLHLLGNLLFLYLLGPFIEDVWGRPIYTAFYVCAGVASALMYALHYPSFTGPLIGASGAIAGVMGAFLIKYWKTKINFFYWIFFFFRGTFQAPAWLMLPLWLLLELFNASVIDAVNPDGGGGVAHWAHVWGFVVGVAVALGIRALKVEEKYVQPRIEAKIKRDDKGLGVVVDAIQKKNAGRAEEAYALLLEEARKNPTCENVIETLWDIGVGMGRVEESTRFFIKLIENEVRHDKMEKALNHFRDLKSKVPQASVSPTYKFTLLKALLERGQSEETEELALELLEEVDLNTSLVVLLELAKITLQLSPLTAEKAVKLCLQHPEIPEEERAVLNKRLEDISRKPQTSLPSNP